MNLKKSIAVFVMIAIAAQLVGCNNNTPIELDNNISSTASDVSTTGEPQSETVSATSDVSDTSEPQTETSSEEITQPSETSTAAETSEPQIETSSEEITQPEEISTTEPPKEETWTENAVSGTYYINSSCNSRVKAIQGSDTVKNYKLNDQVNVIAQTDTGYFKLADGEFIHGDFLSTSKIEQQQPQQTQQQPQQTQQTGNENNNKGNGGKVIPFTGEKSVPPADIKIVGEVESGVNRWNEEISGYLVQTVEGKTYWFDETVGRYYNSMEDALNGEFPVSMLEVIPDKTGRDWTKVEFH